VDKIKRRQLIKGGAAGTLALGAFAAGASAASADEGRGRAIQVHIHGLVGGVLLISMDVAGRPDDLAGAGWDSGLGGVGTVNPLVPGPGPTATSGPVGACYYTAAGRLEGNVVTLKGRSLVTNRALTTADTEDPGKSDTRADGRTLDATANVKTGVITFALTAPGGTPSFLTGTGTVIVFHGGRGAKDDD
jgi:hypothetical protein